MPIFFITSTKVSVGVFAADERSALGAWQRQGVHHWAAKVFLMLSLIISPCDKGSHCFK